MYGYLHSPYNGLLYPKNKDSALFVLFLKKKNQHNSQIQKIYVLYLIKQVTKFIHCSLPFLIP